MSLFMSFQLISLGKRLCMALNLPRGINSVAFPELSSQSWDVTLGLWLQLTFPSCAFLLLAEFFIDGLGSLLVGSCPQVIVGHQSHAPAADQELASLEKMYSTYRANTKAQVQFKLALHYFKNHLQCST